MSTHDIGFYEDLTKIIFELSSNIIKYAPYFFCCYHSLRLVRNPDDRFSHYMAQIIKHFLFTFTGAEQN